MGVERVGIFARVDKRVKQEVLKKLIDEELDLQDAIERLLVYWVVGKIEMPSSEEVEVEKQFMPADGAEYEQEKVSA